jgi:hypothetical protein
MNTRISELIRQAWIQACTDENPKYKPTELADALMEDLDGMFQIFARLMMKECAEACDDFACGRTSSPEDLINAHFGVI